MNMVSGSIFDVTFRTSWENEEITEKNHVVVVAENAEKAIEKAKILNSQDEYLDEEEDKTYHRDMFELLEVTHVTDLDG